MELKGTNNLFQKFGNEEVGKIPVFTSEPPPIEWHLQIRSLEDCDLMTVCQLYGSERYID